MRFIAVGLFIITFTAGSAFAQQAASKVKVTKASGKCSLQACIGRATSGNNQYGTEYSPEVGKAWCQANNNGC